jgi:hypothetical protein
MRLIPSLLAAGLLAGAALSLAGCDDNDNSATAPRAAAPSVMRTSVYDPTVPTSPGDQRPTVPPTDSVTPAEQTGTNLIMPSAGAIGGTAVGGRR